MIEFRKKEKEFNQVNQGLKKKIGEFTKEKANIQESAKN